MYLHTWLVLSSWCRLWNPLGLGRACLVKLGYRPAQLQSGSLGPVLQEVETCCHPLIHRVVPVTTLSLRYVLYPPPLVKVHPASFTLLLS